MNEPIPTPWLEALLAHLGVLLPLSSRFEYLLPDLLNPGRFAKTTTVLNQGEVARHAYWIQEGYARGYRDTADRDGLPVQESTMFWTPGCILTVSDSFFNDTPAPHHVEFAAGSAVLAISRTLFDALKAQAPEAGELATRLTARHYTETLERARLLSLDAADRKEAFFAHYGLGIAQYFRQKDFASFLDMEPETFSRLR